MNAEWVMRPMLQKGLIDSAVIKKNSRTDSVRVDWFLQAYSFSASGQLDEFIIGLIHPERDWEIFTWLYREPFGQGMGKIILKNQKQKYIVNIVTLSRDMCVDDVQKKNLFAEKREHSFFRVPPMRWFKEKIAGGGQRLIEYLCQ